MAKYEHIVTSEEYGMTINTILRLNYRFSSRFKTKIKYQKLIDLNGEPAPGYTKPEIGDVIGIRLPDENNHIQEEDIPLDIIFEDDDLLIINKQPGIIVHPTKGHPQHTIANGVVKYMIDSGQHFKIRFANRIDMETSGIVVVAKNSNVQSDFASQMTKGCVKKEYVALAEGVIEDDDFEINLPIGKPDQIAVKRAVMPDGGKEALTEVHVLERYHKHTLVHVTLHTGRTHQIRVHLSHIGYPIAGDELYGGSDDIIDRQALHAKYIEFYHPFTHQRVHFESEIYPDMQQAIDLAKSL